MAGKNIKGITIDFGGNTQPLTKALKDVDAQSSRTQKELKEVDKAAKLDPSSVELYAQKQELLQQQVTTTSQKLDVLKQAQAQVEQQFKNGDIGAEQYRAFQRELATTEASLKNYQAQIKSTEENYTNLKNANKDLQTFFQATKTTVDDFSDVLGTRLTNAIREGTASTDQINKALDLMGQKALGAGADVEKMKDSLQNINESGLNGVKKEFAEIARSANKAEDEVNGFGDSLKNVAAGLVAGGGIATVIDQALQLDTLNTQIDISMKLNEADTQAVRAGIRETTMILGDEEAAYEGIRRQITLNKDASVESNMKIVEGARAISFAYKEIDFKELIQESHEIGKELGISQEQALAMTNSLLGIGFPPEQLDIIAEYGSQLKMAGFSAEEVQAIMASGVETGTWNIDNLLDGLKEGRIVAAEFGQGVDDAMKETLQGTNISAEALQKWGQAVATGGEGGSKALVEMNAALMAIDDETKRNEVGVKLYGTLWEEQGAKISQTLQGMNGHIKTSAENTTELGETVSKVDNSTLGAMAEAITNLQEAFAPLLEVVASVVTEIMNWMAENTTLVAVLGVIAGAIALVVAACMALAPVFIALSTGAAGVGAALALISSPITLIIAGIAALVAALVYCYTEFETFRNIVDTVFSVIKDIFSTVLAVITEFLKQKLDEMKAFWDENGAQIMAAVENVWNFVKGIFDTVMPIILAVVKDTWESIKSVIDGVTKVIQGIIKTFSSLLTGDWEGMWEGIKTYLSGMVQVLWGIIEAWFLGKILKIFKMFKDKGEEIVKLMGDKLKSIWESISSTASSIWEKIKNFITKPLDAAKDMAGKAMDWLKSKFDTVTEGIRSVVSTKFEAVKKLMTEPVDKAKDLIGKAIDTIKGFFSNLKLSFPKIDMPPLPHFSLSGKFSLNPPSVPKLDIDWYAKGGLMTSPTAFGMNGNSLMVGGEAGKEAILPLTPKVLGGIGEGIAKQMNMNNQPQIVYVQPAPVYMDGALVGEITFDTVNQMQFNKTNIAALSKGVNMK